MNGGAICGDVCVYPTAPSPETPLQERERNAVRIAIELTRKRTDGAQRLELIKLVYWDGTHSVQEAAAALGITNGTALGFLGDGVFLNRQEEEHHRSR